MLARENRITDAEDFRSVMRRGKKATAGPLLVSVLLQNNASSAEGAMVPKVGFVVPKRVMAKATDRNQIKRRLREIARRLLQLMPSEALVVVTVVKMPVPASYDSLKTNFIEALDRCLAKVTK